MSVGSRQRAAAMLTMFSLMYGSNPGFAYNTGKASIHSYPHPGYVTAARGVNRGAILEVWNPLNPRKKIRVKVVDACGYPMKRMGRILDLNPRAFIALYGSTKRGVGPVSYRLIKNGRGAYTGKP